MSFRSRIECGDAMQRISMLEDGCIGSVISDPPFFTGIGRPSGDEGGGLGGDPWSEVSSVSAAAAWATPLMKEFRRVTRKGGAVVLMAGVHAAAAWMQAAEDAGLVWMAELVVLWNAGKPRARNFGSLHTHILWFSVPGGRHEWNSPRRAVYSNIIMCKKVPVVHRLHPAQKPIELTNYLISMLTRPNDAVLDPFCGSGSTLVSAELAERPYLGVDRDKKYAKIAQRRVAHAEVEDDNPVYLWVNGRLEEV